MYPATFAFTSVCFSGTGTIWSGVSVGARLAISAPLPGRSSLAGWAAWPAVGFWMIQSSSLGAGRDCGGTRVATRPPVMERARRFEGVMLHVTPLGAEASRSADAHVAVRGEQEFRIEALAAH